MQLKNDGLKNQHQSTKNSLLGYGDDLTFRGWAFHTVIFLDGIEVIPAKMRLQQKQKRHQSGLMKP